MTIVLNVEDYTKNYGPGGALQATVLSNGSPLVNTNVNFTINGVTYTRITNDDGVASLNINLMVGRYPTIVESNNLRKLVMVTVKNVSASKSISLSVTGTTKYVDESGALVVKATSNGSVLIDKPIYYLINGVWYTRNTDSDGQAKLNINLNSGEYACKIYSFVDDTYIPSGTTVTMQVRSRTRMEGIDITKTTNETKVYQCAVYDSRNFRVKDTVTITANGVPYVRTPNDDGLYQLNITWGQPGTYKITSKFNGNSLYDGSSVDNIVQVNPSQDFYITKVTPNNRGVANTVISYVWWDVNSEEAQNEKYVENMGKTSSGWVNWGVKYKSYPSFPFVDYEINETDPRVKTAKFTTDKYFDLTIGQIWIWISSPFHENFGGTILDVDYDKDKGLYTYTCQDGRRNYLTKRKLTIPESAPATVYETLQTLLATPALVELNKSVPFPLNDSWLSSSTVQRMISGLHPIDEYNTKLSYISTASNYMKQSVSNILSYDSIMDKIMNFAHYGGMQTDVWFDTHGICHIDPIDLDIWMNQGIRLTHTDLINYSYGFNITNIITGVEVKDNAASGRTYYGEWDKLRAYFGTHTAIVDASTTNTSSNSSSSTTTTTTSSNSSNGNWGLFKTPQTFAVGSDNNYGYNTDSKNVQKVIDALKSAGHSCVNLGVGDSVVQNYGNKSASSGKIGVMICSGVDPDTAGDFIYGMKKGYYHYKFMLIVFLPPQTDYGASIMTASALKTHNMSKAHDWWQGWSSGNVGKTMYDVAQASNGTFGYVAADSKGASFDTVVAKLKNGNLDSIGTTTVSTNTSNTSTTTTTTVDATATYQKALEEMTKEIRNLLSFKIKIPLNSTVFKNLHTNQMLFTELPREFELGNLQEIFKILPTYKVNRGVPYQENRWYVEGVKIKGDNKGAIAELTLNPFPSPYSTYSKAITSYMDAYNQAFKSNTTNSTTTTTTTTTTSSNKNAKLGTNDCFDNNVVHAMAGAGYGNSGHGRNFDSAAQKGYAIQGANYYNWARQYNDILSLLKAIAKICNPNTYVGYSGHRTCPQKAFNTSAWRVNCYDAARLVKVCCDSAGFDCVVITGYIYNGGHGWNAVKYNGKWYTFDCFYTSRTTSSNGTNSIRSVW